MKQEEKAKAYDEAIERAKKWSNAPNIDKIPTFGNRVIEEIFPELCESEDEKIKQKIIKLIKMSNEVGGFALHKVSNNSYEHLNSLYNDLKKLTE